MHFYKFHGTGNDFIMIENLSGKTNFSPEKIAKMCDRHFGIGADGVILVEVGKSEKSDFFMNYINADGSLAEMCGNGTRCTAHFAREILGFSKNVLNLETRAGIKKIEILPNNFFTVNMGAPNFEKFCDFPKAPKIYDDIEFSFVSMGNPHAVGFFSSESAVNSALEPLGARIESDRKNFPNKINVNFVFQKGQNHFGVKTFERGAGPTLACGTGASASFAWILKKLKTSGKIQIDVPGGTLFFEKTSPFGKRGNEEDFEILMTGPSARVFEGKILI